MTRSAKDYDSQSISASYRAQCGVTMPIATPEIYGQMLDRAKAGAFAYPAINVSSSQTIIAALRGFAEAESDGIIQFSWGGAEYASGSTCLLYTSPSPRDRQKSRMPSSA